MNGGFGLVLDGSDEAEHHAKSLLSWDVNNGVSYLLTYLLTYLGLLLFHVHE